MNIQITKEAIEYLTDMCGIGKDEAEEHLTTSISMCKFPETNIEKLKIAVRTIAEELEEHRVRYNVAAHDQDTGTFKKEYWAGRRDEAGHFRDKLLKVLDI